MHTSRIRLVAISAATLALIVAGTATVAAHPGDREDRNGFAPGRIGGYGQQGDLRAPLWDRMGGPLAGAIDAFVRRETTYETEDGLVTQRVDNGTVSAASEATVEYTLVSGETASVATDEDTQLIIFTEQTVALGRRGLMRERLMPESIELADITAGSDVVVWAESQADGTFLAQRIVVQPVGDEAAADTEADAGADTSTEGDTTDDAAAADA